jgi:uncharacterized protein (DUF4415 family)
MSKRKPDHISQQDWDAVDIPEATEEDFRNMRSAREVAPEIVAAYERGDFRRRGPQKAPTKVATTIRLDPDIIEHFKAGGAGWQTRLNDTLRHAIGKD